MADWRLRPLDPAVLAYARDDTHHLLYIADRLKVTKSFNLADSGTRTVCRMFAGLARDKQPTPAVQGGLPFVMTDKI